MRNPGIDPRDELWLARQLTNPPPDEDGVCFATWYDELLGPFACKADGEAAQNCKLAELEAQGIDSAAANPQMSIILVDPAVYHTMPVKRTGEFDA